MSTKTNSPKAYHHGDLRRALIEAGLAILRDDGIESITLRNVASVASVSHSASYHHFQTKSGLLAAIATSGFETMVATIEDLAGSLEPNDPVGRLRAIGRGYVLFATQNPQLFRLMFRPELTLPDSHPQLKEAEQKTFGTLFSAVQAYLQGVSNQHLDPRIASGFAWSTVHGISTLYLDRVLGETPVGQIELEDLTKEVLELIIGALNR
jgi:AcrR family transcriptional regulator